jgi:hypothetical protein
VLHEVKRRLASRPLQRRISNVRKSLAVAVLSVLVSACAHGGTTASSPSTSRQDIGRQIYIACMEGRGYQVRDDLYADKLFMSPGEKQRDQSECATLAGR